MKASLNNDETGCFVEMTGKQIIFLTLVSICLQTNSFAVVNQEERPGFSRLSIPSSKSELKIETTANEITFSSLDRDLLQEILTDISQKNLAEKFINTTSQINKTSSNSFEVKFSYKNQDIEGFSFYRDIEKKYVVDLWKNSDEDQLKLKKRPIGVEKGVSLDKKVEIVEDESINRIVKKDSAKDDKKNIIAKTPQKKSKTTIAINKIKLDHPIKEVKKEVTKKHNETDYRDFRYGANLTWENEAIYPELKDLVNLQRKIPESLYPISNRDINKGEKEETLQLAINMYRKDKYGLMNKALKIYEEKFGHDSNIDTIEFLKANALLKDNIIRQDETITKVCIQMMDNIASRSTNYEMKKAIYKYLISFYYVKNDPVKLLELGKKFYVQTRQAFDNEESEGAVDVILHALSRSGLPDKIIEVTNEKTISKFLPKQKIFGYLSYAYLKTKRENDLISLFEKNEKTIVGVPEQAFLYNLAEAYFRKGHFEKSLKTYDKFVKNYSFSQVAADARLRLALVYELLERNPRETEILYREVLDKAVDFKPQFEARLRYVALRNLRNTHLTDADKEYRILLNIKSENEKFMTTDLKKLLWLVRLRLFIVDKNYTEAMTYLSNIPLINLGPTEKRMFEAEGAEIVYGLIISQYEKGQYDKVVQIWDQYKKIYMDKVALDPYMNFVAANSYLSLGILTGYSKVIEDYKAIKNIPEKTYPIWIERNYKQSSLVLLQELQLVKMLKKDDLQGVKKEIEEVRKLDPNYNKLNYYEGILSYENKDYKSAIKLIEKFLTNKKNEDNFDSAEELNLINAYTDSIYNLGDVEKYLKVSDAALKDIDTGTKLAKEVRERVFYLKIELLYGKGDKESLAMLESDTSKFLKEYASSDRAARVKYLMAMTYISGKDEEKGSQIFKEILGDKKANDQIKDLIRSEMSLMKIKNKTL